MRDVLSRLRAARIPQAAMIFAALMLIYWLSGAEADSALERRISQTLSRVEGAGRVEVTIAMQTAGAPQRTLGADRGEQTPCGAVAVAQGADDPLVKLAITEAVSKVTGLRSDKISVIKMK